MKAENQNIAHHDENEVSEVRRGANVSFFRRWKGREGSESGVIAMQGPVSNPTHIFEKWSSLLAHLFFPARSRTLFSFFVRVSLDSGWFSAGNHSPIISNIIFTPRKRTTKNKRAHTPDALKTALHNETPLFFVWFSPLLSAPLSVIQGLLPFSHSILPGNNQH